MGEKTIVCRHQETIRGNRGECSVCHQVRQYDSENPNAPPTIIERGRIHGVLTEVRPGGKYAEIESRGNFATFSRKPDQLAQRTPENWGTMKRLEKHAWLERHRGPISADLKVIGQKPTAEKWHIRQTTINRLALRWGVECKVIPRGVHKKAKPIHAPVIQHEALRPTEDRAPANYKELTKKQKHEWLEKHREPLTVDMETIGLKPTSEKWHIPQGTIYCLSRKWDVQLADRGGKGGRPRKEEKPPTKETVTPARLPSFPAFNEEWTEAVKVAWFGAYARICSKKEKR